VAEVRTAEGDLVLQEVLDQGVQKIQQPAKQRKVTRTDFQWNKQRKSVASKMLPIFPEPNYVNFVGLSPKGLYDLFITKELLDSVRDFSNEYAHSKFGKNYDIKSEEIEVFFAILLLSGFCSVTNLHLYWSNADDTENKLVKDAVARDRFKLIKKSLHFGSKPDKEGETPDRCKKVRFLIKHMQDRFAAIFVPEQNLSHDEAMIKYFGKHGLKQAIRNKPIRFGFKAWVLSTVSGYVAAFDIYQGKGLGKNHEENVAAVGVAGATLLDLVDLLPEEKKVLPYHFFADNYFTSMKLIDELSDSGYFYTGTIRKDRIKGNPPLTSVEAFKKMDRGYHETAILKDKSQIIVRWNDNAPVTMVSNVLGTEPIGSCKRYSRTEKKYVKVPQPDIVGQYNPKMGGVDRFDQNLNHLRISVGGKKWYYPIITWNLDTAVQNAWQLHRKAGGNMSALDFRREIVYIILKNAADTRRRTSNNFTVGRHLPPGCEELRYDNRGHYVIVRQNVRKECANKDCKTKCQTYCVKCDRALCCYCFMEYHIETKR
jgi:Transposase IS4